MTPARHQKTPVKEPDRPFQFMVSAEQLKAELTDRLAQGQKLLDQPVNDEDSLEARQDAYQTWSEYNEALLRRSFDSPKPAADYVWSVSIGFGRDTPFATRRRFLTEDISEKMRRIGSLKDQLGLFRIHPGAITPAAPPPNPSVAGDDMFIVHGHDGEAKVTVARFLEKRCSDANRSSSMSKQAAVAQLSRSSKTMPLRPRARLCS